MSLKKKTIGLMMPMENFHTGYIFLDKKNNFVWPFLKKL